ncbi:MAG TPA: hypothetical protein VJP77_05755 [Planctomycetota bacterium]|nr:hypothetical protein [Planctomycetota bacterium]
MARFGYDRVPGVWGDFYRSCFLTAARKLHPLDAEKNEDYVLRVRQLALALFGEGVEGCERDASTMFDGGTGKK